MKLTLSSLFLLFVFFPVFSTNGSVFAQKKSDEKNKAEAPVFVKANVYIANAQGLPVDDVSREDVRIFEDGAEQQITYFAKKEPVANIAFVIDNSGSMRENLNQTIRLASAVADNLRPADEAFVVRFVSSDKIEVVQNWTSDSYKMREAFENMYVEGGQSAVIDAVYLAAEKLLERERQNKSKRYAIVLISDGEERDSYYKYEQVIKLFDGSDLQVFMPSYAAAAPRKPRQSKKFSSRLTLDTGGAAYLMSKKPTADEAAKMLKELIAELRAPFVVGYTSSNPKRDDAPRKLTVQIKDAANGEKRTGFVRESFVAPKN